MKHFFSKFKLSKFKFAHIKSYVLTHKVISAVVVLIVVFVGYKIISSIGNTSGETRYVLSTVERGNIITTVSGTGQASASNQLDISSKVSGTIESINVSVGQQVSKGDLIATIDPTNALNSLNSAKIALAKLVEAPKSTDLSNTQNSVVQSYSTAYNSIGSTFIDLQTVMPGLNNLFYGQGAFLSDQESVFLSTISQGYRLTAGLSYDKANAQYTTVLSEYKSLSRSSSTSTIAQVLNDTHSLAQNVANTLQRAQNAINYITTNQPDYLSKGSSLAMSNVSAWTNSISGDVSSLLASQNSIASSQNALTNLLTVDPLDVQSQELAVQEQQQTYANYFIRAPFDGIIGRIPVSVYEQASSGTVMATIISKEQMADVSLNEVDAAKVKVGDKATVSFDAVDGLTLTGVVTNLDLVGTATQGVVNYGAKIVFDTNDSRVLSGMSASAEIITSVLTNVLHVPSGAVRSDSQGSYVYVFDPPLTNANASQGVPSTIPPIAKSVVVGTSNDTDTEIVSGLTEGEQVVNRIINPSTSTTSSAPSIFGATGSTRGAVGGARATGLGR